MNREERAQYRRAMKFYNFLLKRHLNKGTSILGQLTGKSGEVYHITNKVSKGSYGVVYEGFVTKNSINGRGRFTQSSGDRGQHL